MKSIKPGRGPSMMGGFGSIFAVIFGIVWTFAAASMGAPIFFPLFGILFVVMGIVQAVYNFKNATGEHRYSTFDIVDADEEPDPLDKRRRPALSAKAEDEPAPPAAGELRYCPYCGTALAEADFEYCPKCGKKLPD